MIKLEHTVLHSSNQMQFVIDGMSNPMNSCDHSDSGFSLTENGSASWTVGENDYSLMKKLAEAGKDHRKFMRMMPVYVRITAPLYWWKEADTYKIGTVANSCSTMHKIQEKEFTLEDFSCEHLNKETKLKLMEVINYLNISRDCFRSDTSRKDFWWQMIQLLPSSYNQTRNVMLNYEVLANIYRQRKNHKLDEWRDVCKWIESLPYSELITGEEE